jgi:predicted small metal-binding protein
MSDPQGKLQYGGSQVMTKRIKCSELGVKDCDFTVSGETAGEVVGKVVEHLRAEHDIDMPDADVILAGGVRDDPLEKLDPATALVIDRLKEALNIVPPESPETPPRPSVGTMPTV